MVVELERLPGLAPGFRGRVIRSGDAEYDAERQVRNGLIDRRPAVILRCLDTADVQAAVRFASGQHVPLSIRGGGHNVAGNAMNDGGIVIDLSLMRRVSVDAERRTVRAQGGATWGDIDPETQRFGLATTGGQVSSTGVGGYTLHGGMGTLHRTFGLAIDNLRSAEIVTADGVARRVSATDEPDLFWAIRGAGSNFGVVTELELALHPVGPEIVMTVPVFPLEEGNRVLRAFRDALGSVSRLINPQMFVLSLPPDDAFPVELHNRPVLALQTMYAGAAGDAAEALRFVEELGDPLIDLGGRMTYAESQTGFDAFFPKGWLYYWKSHLLPELSDALIDKVVQIGFERPSPRAMINLWPLGGAIADVAPHATPWWNRDAQLLLSLDTTWIDPADTERCIAWTRDAWERTRPANGAGMYLNFAGFGEEKDRLVRSAYGENFARLQQLKRIYDPGNCFHMNNTIPLV